MQVQLYKQPAQNVFSKNPINFGFRLTPFTNINNLSRPTLYVSIEYSLGMNTPVFSQLWAGALTPDMSGLCKMDFSSLLDAQLEYFVPNFIIKKVFACKKQCAKFRIRYYVIIDGQISGQTYVTDIFNVYKGGIEKEFVDNESSYLNNDILVPQGKPLHFFLPDDTIRLNEPKWIYFINTMSASILEEFVNTNSGVTLSGISQNFSPLMGMVYCIPISLDTFDILGVLGQPDTDEVTTLDYYVKNQTGNSIFEHLLLKFDHRPFYDELFIIYRNSLGGLDTQSILGEKDFNISIKGNSVELVEMMDVIGDFKLQSEFKDTNNFHNTPIKANTGWITKQQLRRLTDLILNREVYIQTGNRLLPIYINSKSVNLYKSTDFLYNLQFEYQKSYDDTQYSPDELIAFSDSCPAVLYLDALQDTSGYLHLFWKLPPGYDKIEILVTGTYTLTGSTGTFNLTRSWIIEQNEGNQNRNLNLPTTAYVNAYNLDIKARCICNDEVLPFSYGPYTPIINLTAYNYLNPIAGDDIADISIRNTTMRILKASNQTLNILANDIPATEPTVSFANFCDSTGTSVTTSVNGANLSFNTNGEVEYTPTPTSMAITTQDVFYYKAEETTPVGVLTSNIAKVTVPLTGEVPKVYVGVYIDNQQVDIFKYGAFNTCELDNIYNDVRLRFWLDAAGTIPVDVTLFGIIIGWEKRTETRHFNSVGLPGGFGPTTVASSGAVTAIGTSVNVEFGFHRHIITASGGGADQEIIDWVFSETLAGSVGNFEVLPY